jgi:hypothetical protein
MPPVSYRAEFYIRVAPNSGRRRTKLRVHPMRTSPALGEHKWVQSAALAEDPLVPDGS